MISGFETLNMYYQSWMIHGLNIYLIVRYSFLTLLLISVYCCKGENEFHTRISITGDKWYINDRLINEGTPAEGLLMNVRMVNAAFEDRSSQLEKVYDFDPMANTRYFLSKIPEYASLGVNVFNGKKEGLIDDNVWLYWQPETWGIHELEAVVRDREGNELYRSPTVSFLVHRDRR